MYKTVIFDADGTLIDGSKGILNSIKTTILEFGLDKISDSQLKSFIGPPLITSCEKIWNLNKNQAQNFVETFRNKYIQRDIFDVEIYEKIIDLFKFLKNHNYKLAIATYKPEYMILEIARRFKFDIYFNYILGADNENRLTKKDIMEKAVNLCKCTSADCIMIGDSFHDAKAADELGIDFIGVTYGFGFSNKEDVKLYHHKFIADNTNEIIEFFKEDCK